MTAKWSGLHVQKAGFYHYRKVTQRLYIRVCVYKCSPIPALREGEKSFAP